MVKICVVGCLHGELDKMYEDVRQTELKYNFKTDIILCCGDFQSIRNESDLTIMSVPQKYRKLGDFWKYYASEKSVPYLTVFIGGNHEASNYLQELPYGGWVAPNVYYMGYASVINFGGLRIAGLSGIYKRHDYYTGHFEHAPYDDQSKRTAYHVRNIETFRMKQVRKPVDIVLSHDWPRGIYNYTDRLDQLLKVKPHFATEISNNTLGNPSAEEIMTHLKPTYWFAAHHHCKFAAVIKYNNDTAQTTKFLALDKCLPFKDYIQFVDIEPREESYFDNAHHLCLDPEWLCILRSTNHLMSISRTTTIMPTEINEERCDFSATEEDLKELSDLFNNQFKIPDNFQTTAPVHQEEYEEVSCLPKPVAIYTNPQTDLMCAMLELINPNAEFLGKACSLAELSKKLRLEKESEDESSSCEDDDIVDDDDTSCGKKNEDNSETALVAEVVSDTSNCTLGVTVANPEEINLDDDEDENNDVDESDALVAEQYDPADYPVEEDDDDENGYCPTAPSV